MGRIYFKQYYTNFVEYCFRAHFYERKRLPEEWKEFTDEWFEEQTDEDIEFMSFVFDKRFNTTMAGCENYGVLSAQDRYGTIFDENARRLFQLEQDFAVRGGLTSHAVNDSSARKTRYNDRGNRQIIMEVI